VRPTTHRRRQRTTTATGTHGFGSTRRSIARLIGRQMAREAFERLEAANDNDTPERCKD
jgi:hypothetical protein